MIAVGGIEELLFTLAEALRVPVLVAALLAALFMLFDLGTFLVELFRRRRGDRGERVQHASESARRSLGLGDTPGAEQALLPLASSAQMADTLSELVARHDEPGANDRRAKALADFDLRSLRKLERSRMLVRFGPALGLMGTLIPLSPALEGLAHGNVTVLTDNLRVAFSVTVLGLLVGALAFALSLVRDRIYGQDYSDLEYAAAVLTDDRRVPSDTVVGGVDA
jgi:biopolymer transport protein ExbB/TolQ